MCLWSLAGVPPGLCHGGTDGRIRTWTIFWLGIAVLQSTHDYSRPFSDRRCLAAEEGASTRCGGRHARGRASGQGYMMDDHTALQMCDYDHGM